MLRLKIQIVFMVIVIIIIMTFLHEKKKYAFQNCNAYFAFFIYRLPLYQIAFYTVPLFDLLARSMPQKNNCGTVMGFVVHYAGKYNVIKNIMERARNYINGETKGSGYTD
jgi:hypothetical protein